MVARCSGAALDRLRCIVVQKDQTDISVTVVRASHLSSTYDHDIGLTTSSQHVSLKLPATTVLQFQSGPRARATTEKDAQRHQKLY